jgi:putative membrane protein
MLLTDAALAWLHFVLAFLMVGALVAELFILRLPMDAKVVRLVTRVDLIYGVSAGLLVVAGISRVIWGIKGWSYYHGQPFFWAKMATFALIGLISILPTITFLRWKKAIGANGGTTVPEAEVRRIRRYVMGETHLIALVLAFAVLMARAIG